MGGRAIFGTYIKILINHRLPHRRQIHLQLPHAGTHDPKRDARKKAWVIPHRARIQHAPDAVAIEWPRLLWGKRDGHTSMAPRAVATLVPAVGEIHSEVLRQGLREALARSDEVHDFTGPLERLFFFSLEVRVHRFGQCVELGRGLG